MRRRSSSHSPISLFTFLDTLVCTMGSLILMLLAMTPKIRERAEAREVARLAALAPAVQPDLEPETAAPAAVAPPPQLRPSAEDDQERAAARQRRRDAWLKALDDARTKLQGRQNEYLRQRQLVKDATSRLKALEDQLQKSRAKEEAADADQALTELETKLEEQQAKIAQKIALTRRNIDLLNRQQTDKANEYALVPYEGSSGSVRRPIYLECSGKGFRFLPEDETVSPVDLKGFPDNYNPLLTGTQVLLHYWSRHRREAGGTEPEPYVLLIVRPSGCLNYYIARGFLASLGTNFGYELIEEDWKIRVPDPDPVAKSLLKETLDLTVQTQSGVKEALADAAQRNGFGRGRGASRGGWTEDPPLFDDGGGPGGPPSGSNARGTGKPKIQFGPATRRAGDLGGGAANGNAAENGSSDPGRAPGKVAGSGAGAESGGAGKGGPETGIAAGDRSESSGTASQAATGTGGRKVAGRPAGIDGGAKSGAAGRRGTGGGTDSDDGTGARTGDGSVFTSRRPGTGAADGIPGATGGGGGGDAGSGSTPGMESPDGASDPSGTPLAGRGLAGTRGGRRGSGGSRPATIGGAPADGSGGDGSGDGDMPLELPLDYVPRRLRGPDGSGGSGTGDEPSLFRSIPQDSSSDTGAGSSGSTSGGTNADPLADPAASNAKSGAAGSGPPSTGKKGSDSGNIGSTSLTDLLAPGSDSGDGSSGGSTSPVQMGGPGATISLGSQKKRKTGDDDADGPRLGDEDANARGRKGRATGPRLWGRARSRASIGTVRPLQIRILDDRILIGSKEVVVPVGNGETIKEMINMVVAGIDRAVERWGDPPADFYWVPAIRFVVYPGGNQYYERLREPLEHDWGLATTVELAPDPAGGKTTNKSARKAGDRPAGGAP